MRFIPQHYTDITRDQAIEITVPLHRATSSLLAINTRRNYEMELTILFLSVFTSGGLWVLLSAALPKIAGWCGAIFTTVTTGLILYQQMLGPKHKVPEIYNLYQEIGKELSSLRGTSHFNCTLFWDRYKFFEFQLDKLENPIVR